MGKPTTKEWLLVTAERLYAEAGTDGTSLRQIAEAAGQRNPAVVQYHFGTKLDLLRAIVEYRAKPFSERRLALLNEFDETGRSHDLRGLVEAAVLPLIELEPKGPNYIPFLARLALSGVGTDVFEGLPDSFGKSAHIIITRLDEAMGHLPAALRASRISVAFSAMLFALADRQQPATTARSALPFALFVDDLVEGIAALLLAPAPADAEARLRSLRRRRTASVMSASSTVSL